MPGGCCAAPVATADAERCGRALRGGSCPRRNPWELAAAERRVWLESYKRHLEERLAEVNEQLSKL